MFAEARHCVPRSPTDAYMSPTSRQLTGRLNRRYVCFSSISAHLEIQETTFPTCSVGLRKCLKTALLPPGTTVKLQLEIQTTVGDEYGLSSETTNKMA